MKCPYCNKRVAKGSNNCPHCQRSIDSTNTEVFEIDDNQPRAVKKDNFFKKVLMSYIAFWAKYVDYKSTSSLFEFLAAYIINIIVCCLLSFHWWLIGPYSFAMIVPMFTLIMRRFNDVGYPLHYLLLGLLPGGGTIAILVMCVLPKDHYRNRPELHD